MTLTRVLRNLQASNTSGYGYPHTREINSFLMSRKIQPTRLTKAQLISILKHNLAKTAAKKWGGKIRKPVTLPHSIWGDIYGRIPSHRNRLSLSAALSSRPNEEFRRQEKRIRDRIFNEKRRLQTRPTADLPRNYVRPIQFYRALTAAEKVIGSRYPVPRALKLLKSEVFKKMPQGERLKITNRNLVETSRNGGYEVYSNNFLSHVSRNFKVTRVKRNPLQVNNNNNQWNR